jgi:MFS family permease
MHMKLSYGWIVVGAGMIVTCFGFGTAMSLTVFLEPMSTAMGWSRTGISTAGTLTFLSMAVASFLWGTLYDRHGGRIVVIGGGIVLGLGLVASSQVTSLLPFQLLFGAVGGFATGAFYAPLTAAVMAWMPQRRSLAVALVTAGIGMGSMFIAPLARWLISAYDWRTALLVLGLLAWAIIIPAGLLLRRPPLPAADGSGGAATDDDDPGLTAAQAMRTPQFVAIALTHFACCAAHSGPIFHMITYAIGCGVPAMTAATVLSVAGLAALTGRIGCGLIADRVGAKPVLVFGLALQAVAVSLYLFTRDLASFYALSLLFGLAYGGVMPLYAILVREYFGARIMGTTFGAVAMVSGLGMALGPWAGGRAYDVFASYDWLYIGSFAIGLSAVAIALTFKPVRRPAATARDAVPRAT